MQTDNTQVLVIAMDAQGNCLRVNRAWLNLSGQTPEGVQGLGWMGAIHPDDLPTVLSKLKAAFAERRPYRAEFRMLNRDGMHPWIALIVTPRRNKTGEVVGFIGTGVDITERKQVEESLLETQQRKDEFLATLAHELRNPLAAIRSVTEVMGLMDLPDPELQSLKDILNHQVDSLSRMVDDLLDVSRFMRGKITLHKTAVDIGTVVRRAVETVQPLADTRRQSLHVSLPETPVLVDGDLTRLVQAVGNLLDNAAKYTDEGGIIWVSAHAQARSAAIRVRDTGIGIPADVLPHIFDLFWQGERTRTGPRAAWGLGLPWCAAWWRCMAERWRRTARARERAASSSSPCPASWKPGRKAHRPDRNRQPKPGPGTKRSAC